MSVPCFFILAKKKLSTSKYRQTTDYWVIDITATVLPFNIFPYRNRRSTFILFFLCVSQEFCLLRTERNGRENIANCTRMFAYNCSFNTLYTFLSIYSERLIYVRCLQNVQTINTEHTSHTYDIYSTVYDIFYANLSNSLLFYGVPPSQKVHRWE